ncbi:hypothetical protein LJC42_06620, partial [Eubacteriales bacterium OttesenSCG-928-K08]|nr:hypothetical protein [Eubacteriales bacterium OttesenSCG-928-K08]
FLLLMAVISPFFFGRHKRPFSLICAAACLLCWALPFFLTPQNHITVLDVSGYGYVAHVHTPKEDIILGTPYELKSNDVQAYIDYRALADYKTLETPKDGASLTLNGIPVKIMPGKVIVGGTEYSQSGQLRISPWRGEVRVKAYANEKRYDILIE